MTAVDNLTTKIEGYKKKYDLAKWLIGLLIGLIVGAFTIGVYFSRFRTLVVTGVVPENMVAFFNMKDCPEGWVRADEARGRYLVGVDPSHLDDVGQTVGSPLTHLEDRPAGAHSHAYIDTVPQANGGDDRMMGGGGGGFRKNKSSTENGTDLSAHPLVAGTNAPYLVLSACRSSKR